MRSNVVKSSIAILDLLSMIIQSNALFVFPDNDQLDWLIQHNDRMACGHFTEVDDELHFTKDVVASCQFWTEGILSASVASFGLVGNLISIWVLSVPEMRCTAFNRYYALKVKVLNQKLGLISISFFL